MIVKMSNTTVILIEEKEVTIHSCYVCKEGSIDILAQTTWDPAQYLTDRSGQRLIEEISRRVTSHWKDQDYNPERVVVSLPGTLKNETTLVSSSRLGIREPVEFAKILGESLEVQCYIFHDTECLIVGEIQHGNYFQDDPPSSLVYIFVDEGIGSKILINGVQYLGAGTAGLLGRLIVQPEGAYLPALRSSGSLEAYSSRPGVSRKLVEVYHSEKNKKGATLSKESELSKFRQALKTASDGDWGQITYDRIASGIVDKDPIALHVVDYSARYLGYSINSIITLINPAMIILGGSMISELPFFCQQAVNYARQLSWPTAWNNTEIRISENGRNMQVYGSIELCLAKLKTQS
jgi:glucokinase